MKIPKTMSTQHPDNVFTPFFSHSAVLEGDDEVKEAFYSFSHLKCEEQLWDCEGKEVDTHVVKKLITRYEPFFTRHKLGRDFFLTMRVPNPDVEKNEAKILLETLESIPRNFDIAKTFYGDDVVPIFEIALPMTTSVESLLRIKEYYRKFVSSKGSSVLLKGDVELGSWVGSFFPKEINVIPLFETKEKILDAHKIVEDYVKREKVESMRIWLARSDPALNYGCLPAVLINKIALQRLFSLQASLGIELCPILGCGSAPFRGNLRPDNLDSLDGYPSVHTFTIQSAFKYDHEEQEVRKAVETINAHKTGRPNPVEEEEMLAIVNKVSDAYVAQVSQLAEIVNDFAKYVPQRRRRKLHIGLFGYSRGSKEFTLPRAIAFCASLYSLGLPPEILGLSVLNEKDIESILRNYKNFESDTKDALRYLNKDNLSFFPAAVAKEAEKVAKMFDTETDEKHKKVTGIIMEDYSRKKPSLEENIVRAGAIRGFLG